MANAWKFYAPYLALAGVLAAGGCGSKSASTDAPAAAINATSGDPSGKGTAAPATKAPQPPANPIVAIETSMGEIVVELDAKAAPVTIDEFLGYVKRKHYDGTIFHQVIKDQVAAIVGGQYGQDLAFRQGRTPMLNEAAKAADAGLHNDHGTIAMMRDPMVKDSATCQFFINVTDNHVLDHKGNKAEEFGYCPFGRVRQGMDVVQKIAQVPVTDSAKDKAGRTLEQTPVEQVVIRQIILR